MKKTAVIGAAAIGDYIFHVDHLPERGEIVAVTEEPGRLVPGGCAPNIAAGIRSLRRIEPTLYYPIGDDSEGREIEKYWRESGLRAVPTVVRGCGSGKAWMYMQADGTTMCFSYAGASALAAAPEGEIEEEIVVIAPMLLPFTEGYLKKAAGQKKMIVVTGIGNDALVPYLDRIDVLIINRYEAGTLARAVQAGSEAAPGTCGTAAEHLLAARFPNLLLYITDGSRGSCICKSGSRTVIPPVRASRLRDFTGAGDAYTSGVVSALAAGLSPEGAGYIGAANASFVIEQFGGMADMPRWDDLMGRLKDQLPEAAANILREEN